MRASPCAAETVLQVINVLLFNMHNKLLRPLIVLRHACGYDDAFVRLGRPKDVPVKKDFSLGRDDSNESGGISDPHKHLIGIP